MTYSILNHYSNILRRRKNAARKPPKPPKPCDHWWVDVRFNPMNPMVLQRCSKCGAQWTRKDEAIGGHR